MNKTDRQRLGIRKWIKNGGSGIWCWATGTGKTYGSLMLCQTLINKNPNLKILVSVPTIVLKHQWQEEINKTKFSNNVTVEVINTILTRDWDVDLFIIDEIHTVCSELSIKVFDIVKYRYFLGLTGTLDRLDGREDLLNMYTSVVDIITADEAIQNDWLSPYRYYKVLIDVDDIQTYYELNQKFNSLFAVFNFDFSVAMRCTTDWKFRNQYAAKIGHNSKQITAFAMGWMQILQKRKRFVMSHPKKFEIAKQIIAARPDKKIVTFSATIKDAESLKTGWTLHSKKKPKENTQAIENFKQCKAGVLNTSKAANAGLDVPDINCEIIISGTSSSIDAQQRRGRGIRRVEGKLTEIFVLVIRNTVEESWFNRAHKNMSYITINEEQLKHILNGNIVETRKHEDVITEYRF